MKVARYEWAEGTRVKGADDADPNIVGKHLDLLRKHSHGELTPEDVVKDARRNNSPLHRFFEWNDTKAAEQHRLAQARGLIRAVVAIYVAPDKPARKMRAFVHINEPGAQHYRATDHAMSQTRTREIVVRQAWREFQAWRRRYEEIDEFARLFEEADKLDRKISNGK